jgi:hypothetical protein
MIFLHEVDTLPLLPCQSKRPAHQRKIAMYLYDMNDPFGYGFRASSNACHHQAAEGCGHRCYPLVAGLVNASVSGHLCGPASTLGGVRDEQVQRQLFQFLRADRQEQEESP